MVLWFWSPLVKNDLHERFRRVTEPHHNLCLLHLAFQIPEGSLPSPFLFTTYLNDLPNQLFSSTGVGLFADDTKLYKAGQNPSDVLALHEDIHNLQYWSEETDYVLTFLSVKCSPSQQNHLC